MDRPRAKRWTGFRFRSMSTSAAIPVIVATVVASAAAISRPAPAVPATATGLSPTLWTQVASSCTPDEASAGKFDTHTADFKHKGSATGQIVTRCNVGTVRRETGEAQPAPVSMYVVYRDQDGERNGERVIVKLIRANTNGTTSTMATFDSNSVHFLIDPNGGTARAYTSANTPDRNFSEDTYYVEIRLRRSSPEIFPIVTSIELTTLVPLLTDPHAG
jgi:hypothetical protein